MDREQELETALKTLYELAKEEGFGRGWKRGTHGMRVAEIALRLPPRKSDYDDENLNLSNISKCEK